MRRNAGVVSVSSAVCQKQPSLGNSLLAISIVLRNFSNVLSPPVSNPIRRKYEVLGFAKQHGF